MVVRHDVLLLLSTFIMTIYFLILETPTNFS